MVAGLYLLPRESHSRPPGQLFTLSLVMGHSRVDMMVGASERGNVQFLSFGCILLAAMCSQLHAGYWKLIGVLIFS